MVLSDLLEFAEFSEKYSRELQSLSLSLSPLDYLSLGDFSRQTACLQASDKHGETTHRRALSHQREYLNGKLLYTQIRSARPIGREDVFKALPVPDQISVGFIVVVLLLF